MEKNITKLLLSIIITLMFVTIVIIQEKDIEYQTDQDNYIVKNDFYYIRYEPIDGYSKDVSVYDYAIFTGDRIILAESNLPYIPDIEWCDNEILRIDVAWGTNARELRYYNVRTQTLSKRYIVPSIYADFISYVFYDGISKYVNLFATFDYNEKGDTILVIYDLFKYKIIATIKRDFIAPTTGAKNMIFLDEGTIYIDYNTLVFCKA